MAEYIDRQAVIDALGERPMAWTDNGYDLGCVNQYDLDRLAIETVPSAYVVPVSWIEEQIKWLMGTGNEFAFLTAEIFSSLLKMWRDKVKAKDFE